MPNSSQSWETGVPSRRCRLTAATFSETGRWRRGCSDMARYLRSGYANPHEGFFQFQWGRNTWSVRVTLIFNQFQCAAVREIGMMALPVEEVNLIARRGSLDNAILGEVVTRAFPTEY